MSDLNFEALNAGASAIPLAVQRSTDVYDSLLQNAKVADAMVKANPDLEARMGMTPGQFSTLSAQDKIAATTGYIKNQGFQEGMARIASEQAQAQEAQARAGYFASFGAERTAQQQEQAQDDLAASNYAKTLDDQITNPDENNPDAVAFAKSIPPGVKFQIHAAAQAGRANPRVGAALVRPLMNYFSGPGGQGGAATTPEPIKDAQGNVIATPVTDGKGGIKWIKPPATKAVPASVKITNPADGTVIELPLDEAEARGYVNPRPGGTAPSTDKTNATPAEPPATRTYVDGKGISWNYTGKAADPLTDTNKSNWVPAPVATQ